MYFSEAALERSSLTSLSSRRLHFPSEGRLSFAITVDELRFVIVDYGVNGGAVQHLGCCCRWWWILWLLGAERASQARLQNAFV